MKSIFKLFIVLMLVASLASCSDWDWFGLFGDKDKETQQGSGDEQPDDNEGEETAKWL